MKKIYQYLGILALCLMASTAFSQAPPGFNYQAVIRNASGNLMTNQSVPMRFTVRTGSATGTSQYQETKSLTTDQFGMVNHSVGTGTTVSGNFANITWAGGSKYLQVEADMGSGYVNLGSQQLLSVPYALEAKHAASANTATSATTANSATSANTAATATTSLDNRWSANGNNINSNNSGNVGIGTNAPIQKLDINGKLNVEEGVIQRGGATITSRNDLGLYSRIPGNWMRFVTSGADFRFFILDDNGGAGSDNDAVMTINGQSGNVGFGTVSPASEIHLNQSDATIAGDGGMRFQWNANYWKIFHSGAHFSFVDDGVRVAYINDGTGNYVQPSDGTLKKNITPITNSLSRLMQLRPVAYHYNQQEDTDQKAVGFIAQEVEQVIPEIVYTSEDGLRGLSYTDFAVFSVKAIQEQQAQIETLKAEMAALKAELAAIRNK